MPVPESGGSRGVDVLTGFRGKAHAVRQCLNQRRERRPALYDQFTLNDPREFEVKATLEPMRLNDHKFQDEKRTVKVLGLRPQ